MKLQTITEILKKAIRPNKVTYLLLHDDTKPTKSKGYKIVCESPKKPLPFSLAQIEALDAEQVEELQTMIELRRRKRELEKKNLLYNSLLKKIQ